MLGASPTHVKSRVWSTCLLFEKLQINVLKPEVFSELWLSAFLQTWCGTAGSRELQQPQQKRWGSTSFLPRSQLASETITPTSHDSGFSSNWHPNVSLSSRCRLTERTDYRLRVSSTDPFLFCIMLSTERLHPTHGSVNAKVTSQGVVFKPLKYLFKSVNVAGNS